LKLDKFKTVDEDGSIFFENGSAGVQFYRASGSLWAENGRADADFPDERRPWRVVDEPDRDNAKNKRFVLPDEERKRLAQQAKNLFAEAGLLSPEAHFSGVVLDQVAKLDAKGREIERGVGEASARFLYRLETIDVAGPGAKTYAYFNPGADAPKFVSAYHAWRPVKDSRGIRVTSVEEILERTVLHDPQIQFADKRGDRIELRKIDLAYWALHPDAAQSYVYPVLLVEGVIFFHGATQRREATEFSRAYNAVSQKECAAAGIYADYLVDRID
ncbi:MAG: hypothetical protein AB7U86_04970, partial [Methylocystis sp.]